MYGCESWTIKKSEHQRIDAFEPWSWRLLEVSWTARRWNQSILKEISLEYSLAGLISSVQFSSVTQPCPTLCDPMDCSTPGLPVHHQLPEFTQIHVHWVGDAISTSVVPFSCLQSFPERVFSNESALRIRWPKYWSVSFNISPSDEHSGLISFSMDWLDLLAVKGTLKSPLQHHSSKASILPCSAFFTVQLSHPYMTTGKTKDWCWS